MSASPMAGRCICGAVKFAVTPTSLDMTACHCGMCRRWCAGPMMSVDCEGDITIEGESDVGVYQSSEYGERCFCKKCGSILFWRMRDGSFLEVSAQAFDDSSVFRFANEIFVDEQPANYAFAGVPKRMTGAEFFAHVQSPDKG